MGMKAASPALGRHSSLAAATIKLTWQSAFISIEVLTKTRFLYGVCNDLSGTPGHLRSS